jgi:thermostable 8-oxoguanine DNA glycosylase
MQLDFLSGYEHTSIVDATETQSQFWDGEFNPIKQRRKINYDEVEKYFTNLEYALIPDYKDYWQSIAPKNDTEVFQRWLFAFMSVHTSWKANLVGYEAIKDWWLWINKWDDLKARIESSRVGMQNNRVRYITEFTHKFWKDPSNYRKSKHETWINFRERLKEDTLGLGPAKTSFAIEMCYPNEAKLACLDTHMFQAYKLDQSKDLRLYNTIEQHWVDMSNMWNVPPYVARCLFWDVRQGYNNSRYWSKVLETK